MLLKKEIFGYKCDGCQLRFQDYFGDIVFDDVDKMERMMERQDWKKIDNKWYCPDCLNKLDKI